MSDEPRELPAATSSARVISSTIDLFTTGLLLGVANVVLVVAIIHPTTKKLTDEQAKTQAAITLALLVVAALVFVLMERTGGSLGKRITKLRTVSAEGVYPAPWSRLVMKYLLIFALLPLPFIGTLAVLGGLLVPFWRRDARNAFDLAARLRVVPRAALQTQAQTSAPGDLDAPA